MRRLIRSYIRGEAGAAAAEFALVTIILVVPMLSVIDGGIYIYNRTQVQQAAQVAAQAVWTTCSTAAQIPALSPSTNCPTLTSPADKVLSAAQSTSLGTAVTVTSRAQGYYCVNSSGALQLVATPPTASPANCSSVVVGSTTAPGYYVRITTSYSYAPLFTYISFASLLTTPITQTAWMRVS